MVGLALTSVGVSQIPVTAGAQATWRRYTYKYHEAYVPLRERMDILKMQIRMLTRRAVFPGELPMDLPESIAIEKLYLAGDLVNQASLMCQEYEELPVDSRNSWGREQGKDLRNKIENAEKKIGLVARYAALRSQELIFEMNERVLRLEENNEAAEEVGEGGGNPAEEVSPDQGGAEHEENGDDGSVGHGNEEAGGISVGLATMVVWTVIVVFSATVLVRVGRQL